MTEEEIRAELDRIARALSAKGYDRIEGYMRIGHNQRCFGWIEGHLEDERRHVGGFGDDAVAAIADMTRDLANIPSVTDLMRQNAVEALEAARLACSKIDADDVAASLAALVTRLSEDLLEHKEGAA